MSQSYKSSTDPRSTPGSSGLRTYSNHNGINATFFKSTGEAVLSGAIKYNPTLVTGTTTLKAIHSGQVAISSTANVSVTLPDAQDGLWFSLTNINTGDANIETFGSQTIHGDPNFIIYTDENLSLSANNSNWYLI